MPPVVISFIGAAAAAIAAKLIAIAVRKVNADLDRVRRDEEQQDAIAKLERDPVTGKYRPVKS